MDYGGSGTGSATAGGAGPAGTGVVRSGSAQPQRLPRMRQDYTGFGQSQANSNVSGTAGTTAGGAAGYSANYSQQNGCNITSNIGM